jgi:CubicO group peptidase (beta-lactamase class C family)
MHVPMLLVSGILICAPSIRADHAAEVQRLVEPLVESGTIVGCVVGITDSGQQEIYGFGEIHRGGGDRPDGNTIYEIGSITKAFTGTLLGDLVIRGVVKLDAPLQDFLPSDVKLRLYKDHAIKLVDVASQSSGLPRMPTNMRPKDPQNPYVDYTPKRMYEFLKGYKITRAPGDYEYSNLGMGLLGCILTEKAGKRSYEELVVQRICDPLKMSDTRIMLSDEQRKRFAPPYNGGLEDEHTWEFDAFAGAGALRSTANDMLKFAEAALSDDDRPVVKAIRKAWTPHFGKPGEIRVGLGWHLARDGQTWLHSGQTAGYTSAIYVYPPKKLAVVVLCNTGTETTTILTEKLLLAALGAKPDPIELRKPVDVSPDILKSYEGTYALSLLFALTITLEDGKLMAQATNQDKVQIFPESDIKFFYKVVNAQITFEKNKDGKVTKLVLHQNGRDMPGIKLPAPEHVKSKKTEKKKRSGTSRRDDNHSPAVEERSDDTTGWMISPTQNGSKRCDPFWVGNLSCNIPTVSLGSTAG